VTAQCEEKQDWLIITTEVKNMQYAMYENVTMIPLFHAGR